MVGRKLGLKVSLAFALMFVITIAQAHPIQDYYKTYKNDKNMEARIVPPKMAALLIDEDDYPEAIDVLQSLTTLKYMNYSGEKRSVKRYHEKAVSAKGIYKLLLKEDTGKRNIVIFGTKKKGTVRKLMAVVQTETQFLLLIGKGKLTDKQIQSLPALAKELM